MIQLTLSFATMAAARKALLELPENLFENVAVVAATEEQAVATAKGNKEEAKAAKKQEHAPTPTTAEPAAAPEPKAEPSAPSVDYPTLQKAVFALAGKNREAAGAMAATFGVKTFKELDSSRWAEALAAVNAKIAELG